MLSIKTIACALLCTVGFSTLQASEDQAAPAKVFSLAIEKTHERVSRDPYAHSSVHAGRITNDFVAGLIASAWRLSHYARHLNAPAFSVGDEFIGLPGLYNPDNIYRNALLEETGSYRISGSR